VTRARWALAALLAIGVAGIVAWEHRLALILRAAPILADLRDPIAPNRPVEWEAGPSEAQAAPAERPPNVVIILADDMGFNDVSFYNGGAGDGSVKTPHIDSIARDGVVFRQGYAANAVCAPSRASIMTGRYATRFGFEFTPFFRIGVTIMEIMNEENPRPLETHVHRERLDEMPEMQALGMPPSEITLAEMLKRAGYQTAHIGKWHLGSVGEMRPEHQGFDDSLDMAGMLYLPEDSTEVVNAKQDFDPIDKMVWASARYAARFDGSHSFEPKGYLTDYYTDQALQAIEANRHRPFLLYLAHWGIHNPLQAKKSDYDALVHIDDHALRVYSAMILALDRGVGRVLDALERHGLAENTLVIFTSDNGGAGYLGLPDVNKPFRGWKLTHFEGGTHVPFFAKWPARIPAGTRFDAPVSHLDLFPTAAAAAGVTLPDDRPIDGVDLVPFVRGERDGVPHTTLFWRQGYLKTVLHGNWKLIRSGRPDRRFLFDLRDDPTEQRDRAAEHPEVVAELEALLAAHDAEQAEPAWPSVIEAPVRIDKTLADPYEEDDVYTYWPN
jgi:uncharacterized sulfatase